MNVPKLRFSGFNNSYITERLNKLVAIYDGTHETPNYTSSGVKFVSVENINNLLHSDKYISLEDFDKYKIKPKYDDIFMTRIGDIGTSTIYKSNDNLAYYVSLALLRTKNQLILYPDYLNQYIKSSYFQKELYKRTIHVAFPKKINTGEIGECDITIPEYIEQKKISKFLSILDKKIELQSRKVDALKLFKKGLINYLFSQNTTMKITVKDLGTIITGTTPSKRNDSFWNNGNIPWITPSDITYERDISYSMVRLTKEGLSNGRYLPKDSILVTCIASIGKNAVLKVDGSCNQQINAIIPNEKFNYNYIYYLMEYMSNYMKSIAGTSATSIINKNDFEKLNVNVHSITEQIKIDKILSSIETKEKLENEYLHNITKLKTYLLQNMFI